MTGPDRPVPLLGGMRRLLVLAGVLVTLAGIQLFVFPERTAEFFAWTIDPPLTAVFLGASYWSSALFEFTAAREQRWANARVSVPTVFVFTVSTLIVTLVHLDRFHLGAEFRPVTRAVTWTWLAIYAAVPLVLATLWWRQSRQVGTEPPRRRLLPTPLRLLVGMQAGILLVAGTALLAAPTAVAGAWPWPLTALTGRAVGAWLLSLGVGAAHALVEGGARRLVPAAWAYTGFAFLQGWALARHGGDLDWSHPGAYVYVAFLASTLVAGVGTLRLSRRPPPSA